MIRTCAALVCLLLGIVVMTAFALAQSSATAPSQPSTLTTTLQSAGFAIDVQPEEGRLEMRYKGNRLLVYAFATNQFKPYVRELYTLQGDNVLVDAPPDHLHHHGLMYAIRVNGVNFWEERDAPGYEIGVTVPSPAVSMLPSGQPQASITQVIHWVANKDRAVADTLAAALLIERRTLTVTIDEARQEVALQWRGDFEAGHCAPKITLTGASYHGLGLRLPVAFNLVAHHQNSENAVYPTQGKGDVTPARWSSVSHKMGDRQITVALFGQPSKERGLPIFFTMVQPFTYLSVTQGLDKAPLEYQPGDKFSLDYLLIACATPRDSESLQKRYQSWTQSWPRPNP